MNDSSKNKRQSILVAAALIIILLLFPILYPAYITSIRIRTHNMILAIMLIACKAFDCVYSICRSNKQLNHLKAAGSTGNSSNFLMGNKYNTNLRLK